MGNAGGLSLHRCCIVIYKAKQQDMCKCGPNQTKTANDVASENTLVFFTMARGQTANIPLGAGDGDSGDGDGLEFGDSATNKWPKAFKMHMLNDKGVRVV